MLTWIKAIEDSLNFAKELLQREAKAKEVASLPYRIRVRAPSLFLSLTHLGQLYDEKGADALVTHVLEDLEEIYPIPSPKEGEDRVTTDDHLALAGQIWDYIEDLLPEVAKVTSGGHPRPARLDVLATCLVTINRFLTNRLSPILTPDIMDTTKLSLGDIHMMVDWLCRYQILLRDIYCPPLTPDSPSPSTSSLLCFWSLSQPQPSFDSLIASRNSAPCNPPSLSSYPNAQLILSSDMLKDLLGSMEHLGIFKTMPLRSLSLSLSPSLPPSSCDGSSDLAKFCV
jgi:hypothetical protein